MNGNTPHIAEIAQLKENEYCEYEASLNAYRDMQKVNNKIKKV